MITNLIRTFKSKYKMIPGLHSLDYEARLTKTKLYSLEYRRKRGDLIETYKIVTDKSALKFDDHFKYDQTALRSNGLKILPINSSRGGTRHTYFFNRAARLWNGLKKETVSSPTINSFKKRTDLEYGTQRFRCSARPSS